jgi:hypothetical protein
MSEFGRLSLGRKAVNHIDYFGTVSKSYSSSFLTDRAMTSVTAR